MSKVFKSTNVVLGTKKEIDYTDLKLDNIIKLRRDISLEAENEGYNTEIAEEPTPSPEELLDEAMEEANKIIEEAKKEAALIIEEAYQESKNIYEKAKRDGNVEGYKEGLEKGYNEVDQFIEEASSIKLQAMEERRAMAKSLEKQLITIVIDVTRKVIKHQLEEEHSLLLNLIEEGLEKCTFTESILIRVSERDYDLVNISKSKIFMMTEGIEKMDIKCDPSLEGGSVIIETLSGTIDASVETQIRAIEKLFTELLQGE